MCKYKENIKYLVLVLISTLTACSNSGSENENIKSLNGSWVSACTPETPGSTESNKNGVITYKFNNGTYAINVIFYSDKDCINAAGEEKNETGLVTFIENVQAQSGVTAKKLQYEVIISYLNRPPTHKSLVYIDSNIMYFGAFADDLNVIFFDSTFTKKQ